MHTHTCISTHTHTHRVIHEGMESREVTNMPEVTHREKNRPRGVNLQAEATAQPPPWSPAETQRWRRDRDVAVRPLTRAPRRRAAQCGKGGKGTRVVAAVHGLRGGLLEQRVQAGEARGPGTLLVPGATCCPSVPPLCEQLPGPSGPSLPLLSVFCYSGAR